MNEYENLNRELSEAGVPDHVFMEQKGKPIDTLVNTKTSSHPYEDILIEYLYKLSGSNLEMVVRALTEKKNKKAAPYLLKIIQRRNGLSKHNLWAVGNALYTIDNKNTYSEIMNLCRDKSLGIGRAKLFGVLSRIRTEEAFDILVKNLSDQEVRGDVIEALGRFGDPKAIPLLENLTPDKEKYEFKARNTALKRLKEKKLGSTLGIKNRSDCA
ncbi:HEAT repeat domain-containing protein [Croceimicrobium hydrocarbonivorans]|uniref:HEAT repeat domain-containing protein n=1 Tax=Croceimicrobium hydrocarbonivorans TaxID=2761580 RepID=A0A7H0VHC6_9FLAO|nr:HEAT repeat domain-containing protein [Croceimicrobium hydrocarbonivorans]QNR25124.1 HEAT repeat domain-containing protein [Croceimicrobium hydrocarbonivorans]